METENEIQRIIGNLGLAIGAFGSLWMLFHYFWGLAKRGKVLATVAADPFKRVLRGIGLAAMSLLWLVAAVSAVSGDWRQTLFALVMSVYSMLPAISETQLCENGLWLGWNLIPWTKLKSYQWLEDHKLRLTFAGRSRGIELHLAGDDRESVERLLRGSLRQPSSEAS
jgi:hypothetical protein